MQGWDTISENFNANCSGIKRDIGALKMKLKNLKAHNKKLKVEDITVEKLDECQDSEQDTSINESKSGQKKVLRKRSKVWSSEETDLLNELVEKHFHCLDTSLTRESLSLRSQAWETIVSEFNAAKDDAIHHRDINELKIKLKNMKAKRTNFKTESESGNPQFIEVETVPEENVKNTRSRVQTSTVILNNELASSSQRSSMPAPSRNLPKVKAYEVILDGLDPMNDYSDEDDVSLNVKISKISALINFFISVSASSNSNYSQSRHRCLTRHHRNARRQRRSANSQGKFAPEKFSAEEEGKTSRASNLTRRTNPSQASTVVNFN